MENIDVYVGYEFEIEDNIDDLIVNSEHLTKHVGCPHPYHDTLRRTRRGEWRVEKDDSLRGGAEFITPVQKMDDSFKTMREFFSIVENSGSVTTQRCGCHTNMCLMSKGAIIRQDESAIITDINWRLLYSLWNNRIGTVHNRYCTYLNTIIKNMKNSRTTIPTLKTGSNVLDSSESLSRALLGQYHGFIVKKASLITDTGHYYELRFLGGVNYHLHPEKIETTVKHFGDILKKSMYCTKKSNLKKNRKIISYINRVSSSLQLPTHALAEYSHIELLDNIKTISKMYSNPRFNNLPKQVVTDIVNTVHNIHNVLGYCVGTGSHNKFCRCLTNKINNDNIVYYIIKCCTVNNHKIFTYLKSMELLRSCGLKLTIPADESDIDKLWVLKIYHQCLKHEEQQTISDSIKNKKIKKYFLKQLSKIEEGS